jgi:hypothetical protein
MASLWSTIARTTWCPRTRGAKCGDKVPESSKLQFLTPDCRPSSLRLKKSERKQSGAADEIPPASELNVLMTFTEIFLPTHSPRDQQSLSGEAIPCGPCVLCGEFVFKFSEALEALPLQDLPVTEPEGPRSSFVNLSVLRGECFFACDRTTTNRKTVSRASFNAWVPQQRTIK